MTDKEKRIERKTKRLKQKYDAIFNALKLFVEFYKPEAYRERIEWQEKRIKELEEFLKLQRKENIRLHTENSRVVSRGNSSSNSYVLLINSLQLRVLELEKQLREEREKSK